MSSVLLKQPFLLVCHYRNLVQSQILVLNVLNCSEPENNVLITIPPLFLLLYNTFTQPLKTYNTIDWESFMLQKFHIH